MWTTLIIWLAEMLIKHFLSSNVELKRQLDDAVRREADLKSELADHEAKQKSYAEAVDEAAAKVGVLSTLLHDVEATRKEMEADYEAKKKASDNAVDGLTDHDVVRAAI